jgi:hypothetical protein
MSTSTASSTQALLNHFLQQLWVHDWGYILFLSIALAIDAAATEMLRSSRRRNSWRR